MVFIQPTAGPVVRTASYGAPVISTAPVTTSVSYAAPMAVQPIAQPRGYLLLSPADREEMEKEKGTWDEVYKVINKGGVPSGLHWPVDATKINSFEADRNQTKKSAPLNAQVQKRIDRAAQAIAESCLDGAETRRIEAVRMSGGVDKAALDRKRQLLELAIRCLAPEVGKDPITNDGTPPGQVSDYINTSREHLDGEQKFSEEVYETLLTWWKLTKASQKTDYMLNEILEVEPEVASYAAPIAPMMTASTVPYVDHAYSHQAFTSPAFSQSVFHN
jgi:hypothetical protein